MTEKDLHNEWAWSQIEGYADGSLSGAARQRMRAALREDVRLRAAVERAHDVRAALRRAPPAPLPAGLRRRLLRISDPAAPRWRTFATAVTAAAAIAATVLWLRPEPAPPPVDARAAAAVEDFELAMKYMQKSAAITSREVSDHVGGGLREALTVSGNSLRESAERTNTGG
jgi:anti-sigma factor RsiW